MDCGYHQQGACVYWPEAIDIRKGTRTVQPSKKCLVHACIDEGNEGVQKGPGRQEAVSYGDTRRYMMIMCMLQVGNRCIYGANSCCVKMRINK